MRIRKFISKYETFRSLILAFAFPSYLKNTWASKPQSEIHYYVSENPNQQIDSFLTKFIKLNVSAKSILELGCYDGRRLAAVAKSLPSKNTIYKGIDINRFAVDYGNSKYSKILNFNLEPRDLTSYLRDCDHFDLIFSWATLMYVHPILIKRVLNLSILKSKTFIFIEPTSQKNIFFPSKNLSYVYDYDILINNLNINNIQIQKIEVPREIWQPKYGIAKLYLIRKV